MSSDLSRWRGGGNEEPPDSRGITACSRLCSECESPFLVFILCLYWLSVLGSLTFKSEWHGLRSPPSCSPGQIRTPALRARAG